MLTVSGGGAAAGALGACCFPAAGAPAFACGSCCARMALVATEISSSSTAKAQRIETDLVLAIPEFIALPSGSFQSAAGASALIRGFHFGVAPQFSATSPAHAYPDTCAAVDDVRRVNRRFHPAVLHGQHWLPSRIAATHLFRIA